MKAVSPLLQQCFDDAVKAAPGMLVRCIDAIITSQLDGNSRRDTLVADRDSEAWAGLMRHKVAWSKAYPERLKAAFLSDEPEPSSSRMGLLSDSRLLSLVDEDDFNEQLEFKRALQSLLPLVEQELAALDARMSSLVGLDAVRADLNPLRPSVFMRELRDLMSATESDRQVRAAWFKALPGPMGRELRGLYAQVAARLQKANVAEAGYRVRLAAEAAGQRPGEEGAGGSGYGLTSEWFDLPGGEPAPEPVDPLLPDMAALAKVRSPIDQATYHAFLQEGHHARYDRALTHDFYDAVEEERGRLRQDIAAYTHDEQAVRQRREAQRHLAAVDRPARAVDTTTPLSREQWGEAASPLHRAGVLLDLKAQAQALPQAMGLDVVRMLVNQVASDPLLLAPVREAVVALEPALLRLALAHPRYFNEPDHPARRLVERVAQRSFRYNDEFDPAFDAFFSPVRAAFLGLNDSGTEDAGLFGEALADLQARWDAEDAADAAQRQTRVQAVQHAEDRQTVADQVAWEISKRPDIEAAPAFILDFLYGPWSLVIADARMKATAGEPDPGGYRKAISQLLWSIRQEVTLRRPAQLFQIVPPLLLTLRAGLRALEHPPEATESFFASLLRLHEPVLKLRAARKRVDARQSGRAPLEADEFPDTVAEPLPADMLEPATAEQRIPRAAEQPWLGRQEQEAAGFADTVRGDAPPLAAELEGTMAAAADHGGDADGGPVVHQLDRLRAGSWVDLWSQGQWVRAELVWASARGTLFMFLGRGGTAHTMTRRSCERLLAARHLRPLAVHDVVSSALDRVREALPAESVVAESVH